MTFLLTNDDGIDSSGLTVLAETVKKEHNVWIAAPQGYTYYFLSGLGIESSDLSGEDSSAILKGNISISPVYLHQFNHRGDEMYKAAEFKRF